MNFGWHSDLNQFVKQAVIILKVKYAMQNNLIDWSEAFDGVGRMLKSTRKRNTTRCYDDDGYEVSCSDSVPGWVAGLIIGVIVIVVAIILVCVATKKCKKKFKCARIVKCCKKNNAEA